MGRHSKYPHTALLRSEAAKRGAYYTTGYGLSDGRRIMEDSVTSIWANGTPRMVTFEEHDDGNLVCADAITPGEALRMLGYGEGES